MPGLAPSGAKEKREEKRKAETVEVVGKLEKGRKKFKVETWVTFNNLETK